MKMKSLLVSLLITGQVSAVTCGIYETNNYPTTNLFKKALAACELGEVTLNQTQFGNNNRTLINVDNCEFNLNYVKGLVKLKLSKDKHSIDVDALGVISKHESQNGSFYFLDETLIGQKGLFALKCADTSLINPNIGVKAKIYTNGWIPGKNK